VSRSLLGLLYATLQSKFIPLIQTKCNLLIINKKGHRFGTRVCTKILHLGGWPHHIATKPRISRLNQTHVRLPLKPLWLIDMTLAAG
jgi:hypothetical protein